MPSLQVIMSMSVSVERSMREIAVGTRMVKNCNFNEDSFHEKNKPII